MLGTLERCFRLVLLLALGVTLLWRGLEWNEARLNRIDRGEGIPVPAVGSTPGSVPEPASPQTPLPSVRITPELREVSFPAAIAAGPGVAFLVRRNLYATSESLTDGYGSIAQLAFPGGLVVGRVIVHDRAGSGIALCSSGDTDYLPSVAPMTLGSAANLRQGERVRTLHPLPERFISGRARPTAGVFGGFRLVQGLVVLDIVLEGTTRPGAPILDRMGKVVGIVVRRRDQDSNLFMGSDHIAELIRKAQTPR